MSSDLYLDAMFERLDRWRHLPSYRLEMRADPFFAAFMPEILRAGLDSSIDDVVIPEFPLRRGSIYGESEPGPNASVKVDYVAVSRARPCAYLVELKTDLASRDPDQDWYLDTAVKNGVAVAVADVLKIMQKTHSDYVPKYMHLLHALDCLGWIGVPPALYAEVCRRRKPGPRSWLREIALSPQLNDMSFEKVYIQPKATDGDRCIDFAVAAEAVGSTGSHLGDLFSKYLIRWTEPAGQIGPNE